LQSLLPKLIRNRNEFVQGAEKDFCRKLFPDSHPARVLQITIRGGAGVTVQASWELVSWKEEMYGFNLRFLGEGRMDCILINRFFWPDESATAMLLTDLAEDLVRAGSRVTVLTSRMGYADSRCALPEYTTFNGGVEVRRLFSTRFGRSGFAGRMADLLSFHLSLARLRHKLPAPDIWFAMTDHRSCGQRRGPRQTARGKTRAPGGRPVSGCGRGNGFASSPRSSREFLAGAAGCARHAVCGRLIAVGECMSARLRKKG